MCKEVYIDPKDRRYELIRAFGESECKVMMFVPGSSFPKVYNFNSRMAAIGAMEGCGVVRLED